MKEDIRELLLVVGLCSLCVDTQNTEQDITFWKTKILLLVQHTNRVNVKAHKRSSNNNLFLCVVFFFLVTILA